MEFSILRRINGMFRYTDKITLIKQDGRRLSDIDALAHPDIIQIRDAKVPVDAGDIIEYILPSGVMGRKRVVDPGYHGLRRGFPAYQARVQSFRDDYPPRGGTTIYNIIGNNSRLNVDTTDNSVNIVSMESEKVFDELEATIRDQIEASQDLVAIVGELKQSAGTPRYTKEYQRFIAAAANHISIIGPFIPALTQLLP